MFTDKQKEVLKKVYEMYGRDNEPVSPTKVGLELGFDYSTASSRCMAAIKKAVGLGVLEKVKGGKYVPVQPVDVLDS